MRLFDTHCHLQDERLAPDSDAILRRASDAGVARFCCCASAESDWPDVAHLSIRHAAILPAYGLHPWYVDRRTPGWEALLHARLVSEPGAIVGEIGLDHAIDSPGRAEQESVFLAQLRIAAELNRPVSLHVRKAWGAALSCLRHLARRPPVLVFHAYSGGAALLPEILPLGGYVSFCGSLTREGNRRGIAAAAATPADRILLESDAPDLAPRQAPAGQPNEPAFIRHTLEALAGIRGISVAAAADLTWQNACRAFGGPA